MNNLAFTWNEMGRGMEAIERMEECVQLRKQVLGAKGPYTPASFANLTR